MSKALRFSEKWFQRALWLVAIVFAFFLIGIGSQIVDDLPKVEQPLQLEQFYSNLAQKKALDAESKQLQDQTQSNNDVIDQTRLLYNAAAQRSQAARETFNNWLATRQVTSLASQDTELLARTKELDDLKQQERLFQKKIEQLEQNNLAFSQALNKNNISLNDMNIEATRSMLAEQQKIDLKIFLYRLMLTLPLLLVALWLFMKKRQSSHWPFVWGFILFALFAFFVELVPYLPSYGGYVRYGVGIILTLIIGHYAIKSMRTYLEKQKLVEQLPDADRRKDLSYELALSRLSKGICPSCERNVDLKDPNRNFCTHCGISLFNHCQSCDTRKNAFAHFCHGCGVANSKPVMQ
ncbi:MAG: hypothetical protein KA350_03055 [Arenimonas sp.]|nr:hypothetical protein [Arenimonas sp.]